MEYNPEYYKEQADKNKEIYEQIEAKKNRTRSDDKRIKQLKNLEAKYRKMYDNAIVQKERLQRVQRILQERQAEPPKTSKVISMLKENEAKKKQQEQELLREQQEQERLREEQERINKLLQRGVPKDEDVREDAAKLGINIDEDLDDKNIEDELAELGGPDDLPDVPSRPIEIGKRNIDLPEVPSHPIELGKKPNIVIPPPPPPLTDEYNEDEDEAVNVPIQSTVAPSVRGLSRPPTPPPILTTDNKPRPVSSANSNQPELINFPPPPPPLQAPKEDNKPSRKTKKVRLGFSETLKNQTEKRSPLQRKSTKVCEDIFINGSKVTKKYFYPSEFPKLTKIKPITVTMKKGGKRNKKSRKLFKKYIR